MSEPAQPDAVYPLYTQAADYDVHTHTFAVVVGTLEDAQRVADQRNLALVAEVATNGGDVPASAIVRIGDPIAVIRPS